MSMSATEAQTIRNVLRALRGERCSEDVKAALTAGPTKLYLETWVIPALELILPEGRSPTSPRNPKLAEEISR